MYPILAAVGLVILLMVDAGVSPFAALRTMVVAAATSFAFVVVGTLVLRDPHRGGILAGVALLALMASDARVLVVLAIATLLLFLERYAVPAERQTIRWPWIGMLASRLVLILLLAIGIRAAQVGAIGLGLRSVAMETALRPGPAAVVAPGDPDIYLILLDGHPRIDVAAERFGIDPAPLGDGLAQRGYAIADRSRSNYALTAETLSSTFDQAHLSDIPRLAPLLAGTEQRPVGAVVQNVINDNTTFSTLRARGYEIEAISSGFEEVSVREADRFVDTGQLNEFEIAMLRRLVLDDLLVEIAPDATSAQHRDRITSTLDELAHAPERATDRPTFVFAHVASPHAPWVFHADGSPRTADLMAFFVETPATTGLTSEELAAGYAGQVVDVDRRLLSTLDRLDAAIEARGRPAVTVVFSDHGSWIGAEGADIGLRFKILLAVRGDRLPVTLEPDLTLVNLMPSLFEQLFGIPWERRPDTIFRSGPRDDFDLVPIDDPGSLARP